MLSLLQTRWLAAFALLDLALVCRSAPTPHHGWLPFQEWTPNSEPLFSSWDYLGLNNPYAAWPPRQQAPESWLPPPAPPLAPAPTIEIVRAFRKPAAAEPSSWSQIPVISSNGDKSVWVALVPRGFEDFVLIRKPFVIVEESDESPKKEDRSKSKAPKENKDSDEMTPMPESTSSSPRTTPSTTQATSPTTVSTTTSTTTLSTPVDMATMSSTQEPSSAAT